MEDHQRPQDQEIANAWATKGDLEGVISSKEHFIALFSIQGGFFLPPKQFITWSILVLQGFIRSVLDGSKELIPLNRVPSLYVPPKLSELTVRSLMAQIEGDPRIERFLPNSSRPQDRQFFFAVLATILPDFYQTVLRNIKDNRKEATPQEEKIQVTPQMSALLQQNISYIGSKKKVGQYLSSGRRWGTPRQQTRREIDVRRLF